jgi:hypothetical protein
MQSAQQERQDPLSQPHKTETAKPGEIINIRKAKPTRGLSEQRLPGDCCSCADGLITTELLDGEEAGVFSTRGLALPVFR